MTDPDTLFSKNYAKARETFLDACRATGVEATGFHLRLRGLHDEELATDVCRIGPEDASSVVIVTSATHGVEGFGGSAIQRGLLLDTSLRDMLSNTALVLVHALNPFGFSWLRRVNEDNIDLNRNFVDHAGGNYPENELFEELYPYAVPRHWDAETIAWCDAKIAELGERHGADEVRKAMAKGQYLHPDSVHFGGFAEAWSNRTLRAVCEQQTVSAVRAVLLDLHTGLGPYGYGELMTPSKPGESVYDRLHAWFGKQVHSTTAGASGYAGSKGSILAGFRPGSPTLEWTPVGLEFGTHEWSLVNHAMRADIWLYAYGNPAGEQGDAIRRQVRDAFYIDEARWKSLLWERGREVVRALVSVFEAKGFE